MYIQKKINDVNVVAYKMPYVNSVYIGIWIKVGSRYENKENNGISHFIEHMVFKGSKNRSAKDIAEEIDNIGGQLNGFTGKESTCFYVKVYNSYIEKAVDVLFDMVFNPLFKSEDIEKEKNVVLEEINMNNDSPEDVAYDMLANLTWKGNPLSYPVLGYEDTVKSFDRDTIVKFYRENYFKDNIVISIAGNFDDSIFDIISRKTLYINSCNNAISLDKPDWNKGIVLKSKEYEQVNICISMPGINYSFDSIYTLSIVSNAFGGGMSSRLFQKIREEEGLVYSIYSYPSTYIDTGAFTIFASTAPENLKSVYELIIEEILKVKNDGFSEFEVNKFREQLKISILMDMDSISSRMSSIGKSLLFLKKVYTVNDIVDKIDSITYDDVNNLAKKIFNIEQLGISVVGDINEKQIGWMKIE
ncbi:MULTISPECIES: M16 family metallopeptidase [Thermoanaerobacterium]|uniref:Processing peptidase n=1 Tax=Thermoanaerobacterium xylanolyticum (strain ATCC 49914 / DSM 7097 / LX-11) TaxID=858215 RepID=F6BFH2_THEXL|nr:pitrilysin family protein [Thermoanaerobacterium xylanolyticum]AEF17311.1 processing peptidase [Thermoanaerobacterium xylanolyticum LX-11]